VTTAPELEPYLSHLRALPFVKGVRVSRKVPADAAYADYELLIRTVDGEQRTLVELKKTHVTRELIERLAALPVAHRNRLLFAPEIGAALGQLLEQRKLGFVDRAGNCYLDLAGRHVARIQGKRSERRAPAEKAMRAAAYRALFALLAEPALAHATVRALSDVAGISRQAAVDIRPRLQALGILYEDGKRFGWVPRSAPKAIDLFISGYATALRPQLLLGRFRTHARDAAGLEREVKRAATKTPGTLWGGGAACMRLTGHYRGQRTILHAESLPLVLLETIQAIPDRNGPLEIVQFPGPQAARGSTADTVHPLLVYAELLLEGEERAREAAAEILERWLPEGRFV
jgi:hypothetical protein